MPLLQWTDDYNLGVPEMDKQHQKLFDMLNRLYDAAKAGAGKGVLGPLLNELADYGVSHFDAEELYMLSNGVRGLPSHKAEHRKFVDKVVDFQRQYDDGRLMLSMDVMTFLKDWLSNHILGVDRQYAKS